MTTTVTQRTWAACSAMVLLILASSCSGSRAVVVPPEVRQTEVRQRDTVYHTDSVVKTTNTIIRQADSATMAGYGIRLGRLERAWLVQRDNATGVSHSVTFVSHRDSIVHDTVPVPYTKLEYREERPSWGQRVAGVAAILITTGVLLMLTKIKR